MATPLLTLGRAACPALLVLCACGSEVAVAPMPPPAIVQVSAGGAHSCVLLDDGTVRCWGSNRFGQLGDGSSELNRLSPVAVADLAGVVSISAGGVLTCALLGNGTLRCWGQYRPPPPGYDDYSLVPVPIDGLEGVADVQVGGAHTCVLGGDGTVGCWGDNASGQLGDGTFEDRSFPVSLPGISNAVALALGSRRTCALVADGSAWCWGEGYGQLGEPAPDPVLLEGLDSVVAINGGARHTCAIGSDGTARCWGFDDYGQLGDGTHEYSATPVSVAGLAGAIAIGAGFGHSCALLSDGSVHCWGRNFAGELGRDTWGEDEVAPAPVVGTGDVRALSIGTGEHSCTLHEDGKARCWGENGNGELGDGTVFNQNAPVEVVGL